MLIRTSHKFPDTTSEAQLISKQVDGLDAGDNQRHDNEINVIVML